MQKAGTAASGDKAVPGTRRDVYHVVEGIHLNRLFTEKNIRSALSYEPREGDVFIVSYPKCGSTWLQHVVQAVLKIGSGLEAPELDPNATGGDNWKAMPFLEFGGAEGARSMPRPGAIRTHLPFHKMPFSPLAKYVFITRNPYDTCVSYYHHTKRLPTYLFEDGTFDELFDMFVQGNVDFGDYFDHLLSWYAHRNDPNVLFITYEELKKDTAGWIVKMADFFGSAEYGTRFREHPELVKKVQDMTSIDAMKAIKSKFKYSREILQSLPKEALEDLMKTAKDTFGDVWDKPGKGEFVRKGIVGDWKSYFSQEQVKRMKALIEKKTRGTDVMELWKDVDLP